MIITFFSLKGANQLKDNQKKYLNKFFSFIYLITNASQSIAFITIPLLRTDFKCYEDDCYPLAFGISSGISLISSALFLIGSPFYIKSSIQNDSENIEKKENIMIKVVKCIFSALKNRIKKGKDSSKQHWLEYADQSYSDQLKGEVKILLRVIIVFLPLPIFWGLYEQQYSRWVLQGNKFIN